MSPARDPIQRRLAALPRATASDDFTQRLMRRLHASQVPRHTGWSHRRWALAAGIAAAMGAAAVLALLSLGEGDPGMRKSAQLDEMRRQHELLTQELSSLRSLARGTEPVLYLGSVDDVDYVWDLTPLLRERSGEALGASSPTPTSYQLTKETP